MSILLKEGAHTSMITDDLVIKIVTILYDNSKLDEALNMLEIIAYKALTDISHNTGKLLGVEKREMRPFPVTATR
jgi:CIC family chloride channel protein